MPPVRIISSTSTKKSNDLSIKKTKNNNAETLRNTTLPASVLALNCKKNNEDSNDTNNCDDIYNKYMKCMASSSTVKCKDLYSQYKACSK